MAADRPIWYIKVFGNDYQFDPEELLDVTALRKIKRWYGSELGAYLTFQSKFTQGDPDACCCVAWLLRLAGGEENVPEPMNMPSFPLGAFFDKFEPAGYVFVDGELREVEVAEGKEEKPDPTSTTPSPTGVSTETPTDSEPNT